MLIKIEVKEKREFSYHDFYLQMGVMNKLTIVQTLPK